VSEPLSQLFKDWMIATGKSRNTASNYLTGVNTVSKHCGRDLFAISDVAELKQLYALYGPGGEHAEVGASNSNNVQSGLRQWLAYQTESQGGSVDPIEGYANGHVATLLQGRPSEQANWFWMVVRMLRARWPNADHYTANTTPPDVRVGQKMGTGNGKVAFHLRGRNARQLTCDARDLADHLEKLSERGVAVQISSEEHPVAEEVGRWLDSVVQVISVDDLPLKGEGRMPSDYHAADAASSGTQQDAGVSPREAPALNQILYGPPGTGKTYNTINQALAILAPEVLAQNQGNDPETRKRLKAEFDRFVTAERVRFVTFHQSFSYEDFIEGLRADSDTETGQVKYSVESGVFKRICDDARTRPVSDLGVRATPAIWKISINGTGSSTTKSYCLDNGEARIGWGETGDLRGDYEQSAYYQSLGGGDKGTLNYFAEQMVVGDILLCIHSAEQIGSIGVVTSDYRYEEQVPAGVIGDYQHVRSVRWLYRDINLSILPLNDERQFTLKTVYAMSRFTWADLLSYLQQQGVKPVESVTVAGADSEPYVLIIDEINRGNVSRIFGELITLIEESKREGADEALSVKLPYSKKPFSVPKNVYLIGTMNTADRSLAGLDIALRRRFVFREMPPQPELLDDVEVAGLNIGQLLRVMNQRIEVLLDRDHCLGHAYFMPLQKDGSQARLELIFRNQILPLLQEYFFEDWQRIAWVLNDQRKAPSDQFIQERTSFAEALFGRDVGQGLAGSYWTLNDEAFERMEAYLGILDASLVTAERVVKREAVQGEFTLRELASGSVEVWRADTLLQPAKPILRQLAEQLGVNQQNSNGNALNTRSLGRHLIDQLSQGKA